MNKKIEYTVGVVKTPKTNAKMEDEVRFDKLIEAYRHAIAEAKAKIDTDFSLQKKGRAVQMNQYTNDELVGVWAFGKNGVERLFWLRSTMVESDEVNESV